MEHEFDPSYISNQSIGFTEYTQQRSMFIDCVKVSRILNRIIFVSIQRKKLHTDVGN